MEIYILLSISLALAALPLVFKNSRNLGITNFAGHFLTVLLGLGIARRIVMSKAAISPCNFFYVDSLSSFFILTISVLNAASALYSISYISKDVSAGAMSEKKARTYYALFNLFSFSMFFVTVLNNMGMVWVAIEMTTLASAFLVGFHNDKPSIEAAWKYIIICSVGITLALFGTILFYYAASAHGGSAGMNWTGMVAAASTFDPKIVKIAFLFILVGYGTKAGLVPMHTWLPDAHSQALSPISALLSGVLLKTALYAIMRFGVIAAGCVGSSYGNNLFLLFGILSLGVSAAFILVQKDLKRLLAYSSIEHVGIICIGLGIASPMALYGALLHVFNHGVTKSVMFFGAGNIVKKYRTSNMNMIRGAAEALPFTGGILMIATFALLGSPPFSVFISELIILVAAFTKGAYIISALFLFFIAVIFCGMIYHLSEVILGKKPEGMTAEGTSLSGKAAFVVLLLFICLMGFKIPSLLNGLISSAAGIIKGI